LPWDKSYEILTELVLPRKYHHTKVTNDLGNSYQVDLDPEANFDYFTSYRLFSDGTLISIFKAIDECLKNVYSGKTYNKDVGLPTHYTIGNLVVLEEFGDYGTEEKPFLHSRITVLLPVKAR
jgi:hypothetical protein